MDFFAAQARATRTSRWLVLWFALCVLAVVAVLCGLAGWAHSQVDVDGTFWVPDLFLPIAIFSSALIGGGSLVKLSRLSAGGSVVARDLGGRPLDPATREPLERRLLNVVEEMSIASGVPRPEVWVMDDEGGINAFAAGTDPSNAVIGVTRGCIERLDRAELQGVVAHEFSHILNGDMKLNMRLTGWVFGLVMISMLGRMVLQSLRYVSDRNSRTGLGFVLVFLVAGLALWLVGSLGSLFAKLLQAAVSRQREFLADAAAVQFTRQTEGIAGALKKIGGFAKGGTMRSPQAAEAGHFFFVSGLSTAFATHPPLERRIRAIEPSWDGQLIKPVRQTGHEDVIQKSRPSSLVASAFDHSLLAEDSRVDMAVGTAVMGRWQESGWEPQDRRDAMAMVVALLVANQEGSPDRLGLPFAAMAGQWVERLKTTPRAERLALLDSALPWLRHLGRDETRELLAATSAMIAADGKIDFFELLMQKVLDRNLSLAHGLRVPPPMQFRSLRELAPETAAIVGIFSQAAGDVGACAMARDEFALHTGIELPPIAEVPGVAELSAALEKFDAATPLLKSQILRLCGLVVAADDRAGTDERELIRCVAEAIGAPIPPFVCMLPGFADEV